MLLDVGAVLLGLVLLTAGGEALVRGASGLGRAAGLSAAVVGLTVVSVATGAPEIAVSVDAVLRDAPDLALGNAVGSNTVNVLLVLGLGALLTPIAVGRSVLRADLPVLVGASVLLLVLSLDGSVSRSEGAGLLVGLVVYFAWSVVREKRAGAAHGRSDDDRGGDEDGRTPSGVRAVGTQVLLVVLGVGLLVLGADLLVGGGSGLAASWGLSELVIGLTVVAIGTATPEVVTVVVAGLRGERDMALGAVVGSCTVNIGAVVGTAAVVGAGGLPVDPQALRFDVPVMIVATAVLVPLAWTAHRIGRTEGALLVVAFSAYLTHLLLSADDHAAAGTLGTALTWFAGPLAAAGLAVAVAREARRRRAGGSLAP